MAGTGGPNLCRMRDVARRPAPTGRRLRSALCLAAAAGGVRSPSAALTANHHPLEVRRNPLPDKLVDELARGKAMEKVLGGT